MKIHHFDGIYEERWGLSWAMLVSGRVPLWDGLYPPKSCRVTLPKFNSSVSENRPGLNPNRETQLVVQPPFFSGENSLLNFGGLFHVISLPAFGQRIGSKKRGTAVFKRGPAWATGNNGARIIHIKVVDPWSCQTMACE